MSKNLYLDPTTNDLATLPDGNLRLTSDLSEEVSQRISCALQAYKGEWYLDRQLGVPYFQEVLGKGSDLSKVRSIFVAAIAAVPGVAEILELETTWASGARTYTVSFTVRISTGEEITNEVVL